jgi:hypothetical protein
MSATSGKITSEQMLALLQALIRYLEGLEIPTPTVGKSLFIFWKKSRKKNSSN